MQDKTIDSSGNLVDRGPMMDLLHKQTVHIEKNYLLHYHVGDKFERTETRCIGLPMIILSVFVTASIGISFAESIKIPFGVKLLAAVLSLTVSILASLITFLRLKDRALLHHQAADNYYDLLAHCRAFIVDPEIRDFPVDRLRDHERDVLDQLHRLHRDSPPIPAWAYVRVDRLIRRYRKVSKTIEKSKNNLEKISTVNP